jgi:hypothetical protein
MAEEFGVGVGDGVGTVALDFDLLPPHPAKTADSTRSGSGSAIFRANGE